MRAILRMASMAAATNLQANPMRCSQRISNLIQQLRLYKPPPSDGDDRGKVFSEVGIAVSAAPRPDSFSPPRRAAVLVCLFENQLGELRVILTKRSSTLSTHCGEVSLPGGKAEEGDADERETATREAKEEIGLDPSIVTIVTVLEPFLSKHLIRVVPVIGILTDKQAFKPVTNASEVDEIFDVPLEMFLKDENRRSEEREWLGVKFPFHFFDYIMGNKNFVIWGLTASILIRAASVIYGRPPSFDEHERFKIQMPNPSR